MNDEIIKALLEAVKDESGVFWNDDDPRLTRYIKGAYKWAIHFNDNVDIEITEDSLAFELITQRARYQYNNALDLFEDNYQQLLNKFILTLALDKEALNNATTT